MNIFKKKNSLKWHKVIDPFRDIPRNKQLWVTIENKEENITYVDTVFYPDYGMTQIPENIIAYAYCAYPDVFNNTSDSVIFTEKTETVKRNIKNPIMQLFNLKNLYSAKYNNSCDDKEKLIYKAKIVAIGECMNATGFVPEENDTDLNKLITSI